MPAAGASTAGLHVFSDAAGRLLFIVDFPLCASPFTRKKRADQEKPLPARFARAIRFAQRRKIHSQAFIWPEREPAGKFGHDNAFACVLENCQEKIRFSARGDCRGR